MRRLTAALLILPLLASCASTGDAPRVRPSGPPPKYESIRDAHNARVELLDRIWSRTVVQIDYKDEDGRDRTEQVEGHLQMVQPSRLLMTFNKLGELYFIIGSNEERYWWIRLGKEKHATVGRYDQAAERAVTRLELAVHPLDLIELLAVRPLPEQVDATPTWTDDGFVSLDLPARWGSRRVLFDHTSLEPARVIMFDADGEIAAESELTRYKDVIVERNAEGGRPRLPQRFWVTAPKADLSVKVDLFGMETSDRRPAANVFDFDRLISLYRVREIDSLDEGG